MAELQLQHDLMYCGAYQDEIKSMVLADFPQAKLEDASDSIHRGRFSVELELSDDEWLLWLMRKGVHEMSLNWELTRMEKPEYLKPLIKQVVTEQRNEV